MDVLSGDLRADGASTVTVLEPEPECLSEPVSVPIAESLRECERESVAQCGARCGARDLFTVPAGCPGRLGLDADRACAGLGLERVRLRVGVRVALE